MCVCVCVCGTGVKGADVFCFDRDTAEEQERRLDHDEARELFAEARNAAGRVLGSVGLVLN